MNAVIGGIEFLHIAPCPETILEDDPLVWNIATCST